jgi:hypothetical protein
MVAQGPQVTLGGATRGDVIEAKGPAESRDGLGHSHAVSLLLLSRLGKCLAVLDGLVKSRLEPCRQSDNVLQTRGEEWRQNQSRKAGETYPQPGHTAARPWLGQTGQTRRPWPGPSQGSRPERSPQGLEMGNPSALKLSLEKFFYQNELCAFRLHRWRNPKNDKRDLERQGQPSQGTPTPPGYGYLTRHLPRKVTHTRISDSATDEQVLMLEIRGKKHDFTCKYPNVQASAAMENKHKYLG